MIGKSHNMVDESECTMSLLRNQIWVVSFIVVAVAFKIFALDVASIKVSARHLNSMLVYTPADASFAPPGGFTLQHKTKNGQYRVSSVT